MSKEQVGSSGVLGRPDEWIGALVTLGSYVTDEDRPYRPTAVMWLETDSGLIVDTELVRPEEALARAAGLFQLATREPKAGEPRVPRRLRVSDVTLANALRGSVGDVELVVAPTPEVEEVVASMLEHMRQRAMNQLDDDRDESEEDDGWTFLGPDITPDDVAAMFDAAARLYRAAPWDVIPSDVALGVACELMKIDAGAMVVVGQAGSAHGFSLFSSIEDALQFFDAVAAHERGESMELPTHMMFSFDDRRELPENVVEEIEEHGWSVANDRAYPYPLMVDSDRVTRGLTRTELVGVTAILRAVAEVVETEPAALATAWDDDEDSDVEWSLSVGVGGTDVAVELYAPVEFPGGHDHDHQAMASIETVLDASDAVDAEAVDDYAHALMHELQVVPGIEEAHLACAALLIENAAYELGVPITRITPEELLELLFDVLPEKKVLVSELAPYVIDAAQLLMAYADESLGIQSATACRAVLSRPSLVDDLKKALAPATKAAAATKAKTKPKAKAEAKAKASAAAKKGAAKTKAVAAKGASQKKVAAAAKTKKAAPAKKSAPAKKPPAKKSRR